MNLTDAIQMYAGDLREEGKAKTTRKQYAARMRAYARWLADATNARSGAPQSKPTIADFNADLLRSYVSSLHKSGRRPRTICGVIYALTSFGKWLAANDHAPDNPAATLKKPRLDAARRELASDVEVSRLLAAARVLPKARRAKMATAVVSIFAYSALRRGELLNLKVDDLNLSAGKNGALVVRNGKGSKARTLPLTEETRAALVDWLAVRGPCSHPFVFDVDHTRRLADAGLRSLLRDVASVAGMPDARNILPHSLRHNCATRLLRNGADVPTVQKLLGHTNAYTTFIYLHGDEGRLQDLADAGAFTLGLTAPIQLAPHVPAISQQPPLPAQASSRPAGRPAARRNGRAQQPQLAQQPQQPRPAAWRAAAVNRDRPRAAWRRGQ